jgi:hypothetical protein
MVAGVIAEGPFAPVSLLLDEASKNIRENITREILSMDIRINHKKWGSPQWWDNVQNLMNQWEVAKRPFKAHGFT